jgi:hypothetical protein
MVTSTDNLLRLHCVGIHSVGLFCWNESRNISGLRDSEAANNGELEKSLRLKPFEIRVYAKMRIDEALLMVLKLSSKGPLLVRLMLPSTTCFFWRRLVRESRLSTCPDTHRHCDG